MTTLVLGLILFLGLHLLPTQPGLRASVYDASGAVAYRIGFSLLSLAGLGLIVAGYHWAHGLGVANIQLWVPPQ